MSSEHKVVVVTGASQGIGASLVKAYRRIGYAVIANSRSINASDFTRNPKIAAVAGDIASPETAEHIFNTAIEHFGSFDTIVNNVGVFIPKPFIEYTLDDLASVIGVNLYGFFHISQRAAAWMMRAGSGHIVNITASLADQPIASVTAAGIVYPLIFASGSNIHLGYLHAALYLSLPIILFYFWAARYKLHPEQHGLIRPAALAAKRA